MQKIFFSRHCNLFADFKEDYSAVVEVWSGGVIVDVE
jgi:hypothetical protein